jgi:hypothetical protein
MSIKSNFLLDHSDDARNNAPAPFTPDAPAREIPSTAELNPAYRPIPIAPRQDPSGALDTSLDEQHGDVRAYRVTAAQVSGIDFDADSNDVAGGIAIGSSGPDQFSTTGNPPSVFGTTTGGEDRLVQRSAGADTGEGGSYTKAVV